jgi:hypothetical protein
MRLKEIFATYAKQHSKGGGKTLTFDKISTGLENLNLAGLIKMLKDYKIQGNKYRLQFLFKRFSTGEGASITYEQFLKIMALYNDEHHHTTST